MQVRNKLSGYKEVLIKWKRKYENCNAAENIKVKAKVIFTHQQKKYAIKF